MTIDSAANSSLRLNILLRRWGQAASGVLWMAVALLGASPARAAGSTTLTPWSPVFKGIDHAIGTNIPGTSAAYPDRMVMHVMRVDLLDPDIKLLPTPRIANNYISNERETAGYTVTQYLRTNKLQIAINASFFCKPPDQCPNPQYYLAAGTPMNIYGLFISQGATVSTPDFF